jgi:diaminopimelate decarboxylase
MDAVSTLVARYFSQSAGVLRVGEVSVAVLAEKYGTPFFVYDAGVLGQKWSRLQEALPPEFSICYSVKANPHRAFLEYFLSKGCGLEVASAGEFHQALAAGCKPESILFAGPGKTEAELEFVLARGIGEIHAESPLEVERIGDISRRLGVRARVAVRVNPSGDAEGGAMRMGGKPAPFGVDEEVLEGVVDRVVSDQNMDFRGIHLFAGTQILDYSVLVRQYRAGLAIARRVAERLGRPLATVDFGGGLGIPYFSHEQELDTDSLRRELSSIMTEVRRNPIFAGTRFLVEPGRYLVGEAGIYVTRINDIKVSRGKKFLIVNGGMNHHLAASGNLGQTIKRNYPVAVLEKLSAPVAETVDVVGPLCTPLDILARGISFPKAEVGDLVGVFQSGAYGRTASPLGFLSHPTPPEIWVEGRQDCLIRRRGEYADALRDQSLESLHQ